MPSYSQVIPVNQTFSSDTIFAPFTGSTAVYSLKAYGNVNLYSNSSLVRIVLIDSDGNHWLVFESYPLITDTSSFVFSAGCDETCFLDGIVPDSIRIDLISAFLTLDSLKLDTNYISNVTELQAQAKWNNDSVKIVVMNRQIVEEKMYWRAGRTNLVILHFDEKCSLFGDKYNFRGFDYFKGGIFEFINHRVTNNTESVIIEQFDWRERHGANNDGSPYWDGDENGTGWLSPVEDQGSVCGSCWAFTASHTIADHSNLFFNQHLDYNLSETELLSCSNEIGTIPFETCGDCSGGSFQCAIQWVKYEDIHFENDCYPYLSPFIYNCTTSDACPFGDNEVFLPSLFTDTTGFLVPDSTLQLTLEQIAEADHDLPGAWARNILIASGLLNYHEPIVNESTLKFSRKGKYHWTRSRTIVSKMKVFPNPAMDYIIVEYAHYDDSDEVQLTLFDSRGIKTGIFSLTKAKDQKVISTSDMPSGTYFIQLCVNGMPKATCKVVIIR